MVVPGRANEHHGPFVGLLGNYDQYWSKYSIRTVEETFDFGRQLGVALIVDDAPYRKPMKMWAYRVRMRWSGPEWERIARDLAHRAHYRRIWRKIKKWERKLR